MNPFDHSKTRFALRGAREGIACGKCQASESDQGLATSYSSCHGLQDNHAAHFGPSCKTCDAPVNWAAVSFDHNRARRFASRGGHAKLACESCHQARGWRQPVAFAQGLTRFAFLGRHAAVPGEVCRRTPSRRDPSRACASCHKEVDHAGPPGPASTSCHNPDGWPNGWSRWQFGHSEQTVYPLPGAHRALERDACYKAGMAGKASAPGTCHACHGQENEHNGAFGRACEKSHTTVSFRQGLGRQ